MAHLLGFHRLWDTGNRAANWYPMTEFAAHVSAGDLPAYTFIEPAHQGDRSNSQHPGNNLEPSALDGTYDFERGERLLADVYGTLRSNDELFAKSSSFERS